MKTKIYQPRQLLTPIAAALILAIFPCSALAEKHDQEVEQHGSHEHGAARLTVATTDDGLEITLESPAANVFGFEHKAKSEAEQDAVHEALETLKAGSALFAANDVAACKLENVNVESAIGESHDDEKHAEGDDHKKDEHAKHDDDHEKDEHAKHDDDHVKDEHAKHDDDHEKDEHAKHDDDHEKDEHAKHDDDHDSHADEKGSHSDVEATWAYHCDKPDAIETVTVKLFSAFPKGFESIAVEWITSSAAGKSELKEDGIISLKP